MSAKKITARVETITPEKAARWLELNEGNRNIVPAHVKRLAKDMARGVFATTNETVAFDLSGRLIDGQHRLTAIVESGKAVQMIVVRNLPEDARLWVDQGRKRTLSDAAKFHEEELSRRAESVCRAMMDLAGTATATRWDELQFYRKHKQAILWACELFKGVHRRIGKAKVIAVVARASYTQSHDRLREFVMSLSSGMITSPSDRAAIMLRDTLVSGEDMGNTGHRWLYRRTEYLLDKFLKRKKASSRRGTVADREMFLIPGERNLSLAV